MNLSCTTGNLGSRTIVFSHSSLFFFFGHYELEEYAACVIEKCKKEDIRTELERVSGITEIRLFPDFEGFASLRDARTPYTPLSADEYIMRADQAVRRNKFEEAIADYDKAIYRRPNDAFIYYSRGLAKAKLEEYDAAITDYDEAIRLNSDDSSAYYQRGLAKVKLGGYDAAITDYDEAIRLNSDDSSAYYQRGLAKAELRQYDAAIADYDEAIQLNPNDEFIYNQRELVKAQQEQYEMKT